MQGESRVKFYVVFWTFSYERELIAKIPNKSCLEALSKLAFRYLSRFHEMVDPPFSHVDLAFTSDTNQGELIVYSFYAKVGFMVSRQTFDKPCFVFLTLSVPKSKYLKLKDVCNSVPPALEVAWSKVSPVSKRIKYHAGLEPLPMPNLTREPGMCSEFVSWALQEANIVKRTFHPSYITASELFCVLSGLACADNSLGHPLMVKPLPGQRTKEDIEKYNDTIAKLVYLKLMKLDKVPILNGDNCLAFKVIPLLQSLGALPVAGSVSTQGPPPSYPSGVPSSQLVSGGKQHHSKGMSGGANPHSAKNKRHPR